MAVAAANDLDEKHADACLDTRVIDVGREQAEAQIAVVDNAALYAGPGERQRAGWQCAQFSQ